MNHFMQLAIESALEGIQKKEGGPFGACVVRKDEVVGVGHNTVLRDKDSTCHAEMNAIRAACQKLGTHILSDCELYTTAEPCPMCLAAIHWSRIPKIYVGVEKSIAAKWGFDDAHFYSQIQLSPEQRDLISNAGIMKDECGDLFKKWSDLGGKLY